MGAALFGTTGVRALFMHLQREKDALRALPGPAAARANRELQMACGEHHLAVTVQTACHLEQNQSSCL